MAEQQLDTFCDEDDEDEKVREALSGFKETVRRLVAATGPTTHQLAGTHHLGKGKASTWQTAKHERPGIPPLRFVEVLIKEARDRANLTMKAFIHL
ncbi:hypothetical protein [Streptomyces sp. NPDC060198]|uniref:hypothetical protein n=1 Tax=Streptomyces sp. NPDC060198 TaxID=3347070 RepID=UPI003645FFE4